MTIHQKHATAEAGREDEAPFRPPALLFRRIRHADARIEHLCLSQPAGIGLGAGAQDPLARLLALLHPDGLAAWQQAFERSAEDWGPFEVDLRMAAGRGPERWLRALVHAPRAEHGALSWDGVIVDLSADRGRLVELGVAEARLRESERRFRDFAECASDWLFETDPSLRFVRFSDRVFPALGPWAEGRLGQRRGEDGGDDPADGDWRAHRADLKARRPFRGFTFGIRDHEGRRRILSLSGRPVFDEGGRFSGYRGSGSEITAEVEAKEQLERERRLLADAIEALDEGFILFDLEDRLVLCNQKYRSLYAEVADLLVPGTRFEDMLREGMARGQFPDAVGREEAWIAERLAQHRSPHGIHEHLLKSGRWIVASDRKLANGWTVGVRVDITLVKRREDDLARAYSLLSRLIDNTPLAVIEWDPELRLRRWAGQAEAIFGWREEEVLGTTADRLGLVPPGEASPVDGLGGPSAASHRQGVVQTRNRTKHGDLRHCRWYSSTVRAGTGDEVMILSLVEDVTERVAAEAHIRHLAEHDALTQLPNRALFQDRLEWALVQGRRAGGRVALLLLDLDEFKEVNDSLGHPAGDRVLKEVARRLRSCVRASDTVARLGGDEFGVVLTQLDSPDDAIAVAEKLVSALEAPMRLQDAELSIGASMGISVFPDDDRRPEQLLSDADIALYRAKAEGRGGFRFFAPEMRVRLEHRRALERALRLALDRGELSLHFQPQIRLEGGAVAGIEALLRWQHPERGLLGPSAFLSAAESTGLIVEIGALVLREACARLCRLRRAGHAVARVAVNLSAVQFRRLDLVELIVAVLAESGLEPGDLELEISERLMVGRGSEARIAALARLRGLGIGVSLDDFGTGRLALADLGRLPIDRLKIDASLVAGIGREPTGAAMVRALLGFAHGLGLEAVAEGVERPAQLDFLRRERCDLAQGRLLEHPLAPAELDARLDRARLP